MSRTGRVVVLALAVMSASAFLFSAAAGAEPRKPFVIGGQPIPIESRPFQVYIVAGTDSACGGSVLDARRVLTAAHCVVPVGTTTPRPASDIRVYAGYTDTRVTTPPAGSQIVGVASLRVHPYYDEPTKTDDVAVLNLATPLNLAGAKIKPIALAPVGNGPPHGTLLGISGYGMQIDGQTPDGKLYGAGLTAVADDACRPNLAVNASAGVLCVAGGPASSCFGDSGGPLTQGNVQVGVTSYAPLNGCGQGPYGFADVTAPEVRAFIDGAAAVPIAPRQTSPTLLYSVNPPVTGSPMTCGVGQWSGAQAHGYFFVNDATGALLQAGTGATFIPRRSALGATVACVVTATNGGGTSTARSGTAVAVQADRVRPRAALYSARCRKRRCTVKLGAADPNSQGKLHIKVTAKQRGRKKARRLAVRHVKGTTYRAISKKLPRGLRLTIRVRVSDAAGNRRRPDLTKRVRVR